MIFDSPKSGRFHHSEAPSVKSVPHQNQGVRPMKYHIYARVNPSGDMETETLILTILGKNIRRCNLTERYSRI